MSSPWLIFWKVFLALERKSNDVVSGLSRGSALPLKPCAANWCISSQWRMFGLVPNRVTRHAFTCWWSIPLLKEQYISPKVILSTINLAIPIFNPYSLSDRIIPWLMVKGSVLGSSQQLSNDPLLMVTKLCQEFITFGYFKIQHTWKTKDKQCCQ